MSFVELVKEGIKGIATEKRYESFFFVGMGGKYKAFHTKKFLLLCWGAECVNDITLHLYEVEKLLENPFQGTERERVILVLN